MRISDWSSDVCSSDLLVGNTDGGERRARFGKFVRFRRTQISQRACGAPAAERTGHHVLVHAQRCHQIVLLCDVRDLPALFAPPPTRRRGDIATVKADRAGMRGELSAERSEEHTSELQSLMRISYAVFCLKKKTTHRT